MVGPQARERGNVMVRGIKATAMNERARAGGSLTPGDENMSGIAAPHQGEGAFLPPGKTGVVLALQ